MWTRVVILPSDFNSLEYDSLLLVEEGIKNSVCQFTKGWFITTLPESFFS